MRFREECKLIFPENPDIIVITLTEFGVTANTHSRPTKT